MSGGEHPGTAWPQARPRPKRADPAKPKPPQLDSWADSRAGADGGGRAVRRRRAAV